MKKLLLLLSVTIASTNNYVAQTIPNGGFENWNSVTYENPTPWFNPNERNIGDGLPAGVTKVAGVSGFGVRMETVANATDTSFGFIANFQNEPTGEGGVPYTEIPTAITGSYRYSLGTTDSAIIMVFFKKNGVILSSNVFQFRGATGSQLTYTIFSFPIASFATVPDSLVFAAASSNALSGNGVQAGSFLELDNISFTGPGVTQALPGGTFENWTMESLHSIIDWSAEGGDGFTRISPGHSGNYAVQLTTIDYGSGGVHGSAMDLGEQSQSGPTGGVPFTNMFDTVCGYYKYLPSGSDQSFFMYHLLLNGVDMAGEIFNFPAASNWTYFEMPLNPWAAPHDTLNLTFGSSSNWPVDNTTPGSILILDDIHLKSQPIGLKPSNPFDMVIKAYPNPATEFLDLSWNKQLNEVLVMNVYSISGQIILSETITSNNNSKQLNVKNYAEGAYIITLTSSSKTWKTTFIKK